MEITEAPRREVQQLPYYRRLKRFDSIFLSLLSGYKLNRIN